MSRFAPVIAACVLALAACGASDDRVVVAAGTTLVDSGFLPTIVDAFEAEHPDSTIAVVGLSSAEAFAYGDAGSADVLITHEPEGLTAFLAAHPGAPTSVVFASDFLVVAPPGTAVPRGSVVDAFFAVAEAPITFVSRDDGSGTHARERMIWQAVGVDPSGSEWHVETGSGMTSTLLIASERRAVTLAERGAFLAAAPQIALDEVELESAELLDNPYDLTVVSDAPGASDLAAWLMGDAGRAAIRDANLALFGRQVYRLP